MDAAKSRGLHSAGTQCVIHQMIAATSAEPAAVAAPRIADIMAVRTRRFVARRFDIGSPYRQGPGVRGIFCL